MDSTGTLVLVAGMGLGFGIGVLVTYLTAVRSLLRDIQSMRFAGWQTTAKAPQPPKTLEIQFPRED